MWIVFGAASVLLTVISLALCEKRPRPSVLASAGALACTALTLLAEYWMVLRWVNRQDWSALMDVVPSMARLLTVYAVVMAVLHGLILFVQSRRVPREG